MKILLSPAKSLDYTTAMPTQEMHEPHFIAEALQLNRELRKLKVAEIKSLMKLSDALAQLNVDRNQQFAAQAEEGTARPAIFAFNGDVYTGLDAYTLTQEQLLQAQSQIRILSGLYGMLKPLDALQAYRLEMGTRWGIGEHKNLYSFWKEKVTPQLNQELTDGELVVNLASNEYFKVIDKKQLQGSLITPQFKDFKNGSLKVISFYAKKARGMMARHLLTAKAPDMDHLLSFTTDGYAFSQEHTLTDDAPVFIR